MTTSTLSEPKVVLHRTPVEPVEDLSLRDQVKFSQAGRGFDRLSRRFSKHKH
jgi:hypothetical protein